MNRYYIYTLLSLKDGNLYTGRTTDLRRRLSEHTRGEVVSTRHRRPLKLLHYEYFISKEDAVAREKFLKSGYGRINLRKALKRTLGKLS